MLTSTFKAKSLHHQFNNLTRNLKGNIIYVMILLRHRSVDFTFRLQINNEEITSIILLETMTVE